MQSQRVIWIYVMERSVEERSDKFMAYRQLILTRDLPKTIFYSDSFKGYFCFSKKIEVVYDTAYNLLALVL